ncbi:cystathionine gamma-synthase [Sinorhizobium fredii]|uniref:Cystathionine gamma-synthase MetB n=1 Tax=Sinorhizobium fredii (strain USDA 257) TaxID=1185652 RepID=I3XBV8_SINF2|nr:aminotransferase class V-fold PLP-dependent enzyme [Sinorhizobium fredii]AFL53364.1 cystathionine gamma-synthase MetB [Sinorhizobium fredii USDA 257]
MAKIALETLCAQADHHADPISGDVVPALHASTTFARNAKGELPAGLRYSRYGNPTVLQAEALLAKIDGAKEARLFGSGLAATAAVIGTLREGEHIVAPRIMYHGAQDLIRKIADEHGADATFFDQADASALAAALRPETSMVWIESPVNPTWDVIDIKAAADAAHKVGALLLLDATVTPAVTTRALDLGVDIVFQSASKYLNGHSDVLGGCLSTNTIDERWANIIRHRNLEGGVIGAMEAWLLIRGLRTLPLRYRAASANALAIAKHFEKHDLIERVLYPGLESHPGHAVARKQMTNGFSGMMSILVKGDADFARSVTRNLCVFLGGASLGGVESLVEHRASVEGPNSVVPGNLIRFSVGIEHADDLIQDIEQALHKAKAESGK